jgi:AAA15 family ATPase/GTPase
VMVDEIDNGLHHTTLVGIWRAVGEAARTSNTQIFATTHSWECIRAAEEAFSVGDETPDFRYMRLDRAENGDIRAATYVEDFLDTAIATGLEMR